MLHHHWHTPKHSRMKRTTGKVSRLSTHYRAKRDSHMMNRNMRGKKMHFMGHFMASQVTGTIKFKEEAAESEDCGLQGESRDERRRIRETKRKKKKNLWESLFFLWAVPQPTHQPNFATPPPHTHTHTLPPHTPSSRLTN